MKSSEEDTSKTVPLQLSAEKQTANVRAQRVSQARAKHTHSRMMYSATIIHVPHARTHIHSRVHLYTHGKNSNSNSRSSTALVRVVELALSATKVGIHFEDSCAEVKSALHFTYDMYVRVSL